MTQAEFIGALAEVLEQEPDGIKAETELGQFEAWDSTAVINLMVVFEEAGITIDEDKIPDCKTVQDLMDLAGGKITA